MMKSGSSLLTAEERAICEQISNSEQGLFQQRARALLALNEGMSQAQTSELAGLTSTQVRHCLESFQQLRTASIFSAQAPSQTVQEEPNFSSQLSVTGSNIEDSVSHLKQTQHELSRNSTATELDHQDSITEETLHSDVKVEESIAQATPALDDLNERRASIKPDKKKKAGRKMKIKKPKKKPKKPKKPKNKKSKKQKKRKKRKKQKK